MSHASVLIALSSDEVKRHGNVEAAIAWEMQPFDENDECFRDGSRWDWYQVGGRYSGKFDGQDVVIVCDLDRAKLIEQKRVSSIETWREAHEPKNIAVMDLCYGVKPDETFEQYMERSADGIVLAAYAFLSNRHWHEAERMGWFGSSTYTECELKAKREGKDGVEEMVRRCLHKDEATGARVICWNEPYELWAKEYWERFIVPLAPDTTLVNVDYHV